MRPFDKHISEKAEEYIGRLENDFDADLITIVSGISLGLDNIVNNILSGKEERRDKLV